jgi:hypothetical protein
MAGSQEANIKGTGRRLVQRFRGPDLDSAVAAELVVVILLDVDEAYGVCDCTRVQKHKRALWEKFANACTGHLGVVEKP